VNGPLIRERWTRLDPDQPDIEDKLDSRGAQFCAWSKAERKARFAGLLASFDPMYAARYPHWVESGETGFVPPHELDALTGAEWPDPSWTCCPSLSISSCSNSA
jgi:hypothetical protein